MTSAQDSAEGSTKVVYAALIGNLLVATAKFVAAAISGSSAMLTEAIHSSADTVNQILLLFGTWRSRKDPDETHPFGYGMEIYFWTFVVAIIVLLIGGAASIAEGVLQLRNPEPITSPAVNLIVLALSAVFEGVSFGFGYREFKRVSHKRRIAGKKIGMWRFIRLSKDPNLYETLLEDSAALVGIAIAAAGVAASTFWHVLWADGVASIAIGLLLVATSLVIAEATRSLIAGEAAAPPLLADIHRAVAADAHGLGVSEVKTLHIGPRTILVALTIDPDRGETVLRAAHDIDAFGRRLRAIDARIASVYLRFD